MHLSAAVLTAISLLCISAVVSSSGIDGTCTGDSDGGDTCDAHDKCGLYIAKSSIPDAGFGVYSAKSHPVLDHIGSPSICHAIIDKQHGTVINDYEWDSGSMPGTTFEGSHVVNLCPGIAMVANGHFDLDNIRLGTPNVTDGGLHRSKSPGAGAITHFHNLTTYASKPIPIGSELFLHYGSDYFSDRPQQFEGGVPSSHDYAAADRVVKELLKFSTKHGDELTEDIETRVLSLVQSILSDVPETNMAANIVPQSFKEMKDAAKIGTARLQLPDSIRSLEWLETNGWCADNIRPGQSTKPDAGWGAFATRPLSKGEIVSVSPLLHLFEDTAIDSVRTTDPSDTTATSEAKGKQLLLNYCFGDPESSIVLYPYAPVVNLINHDSDRPNVVVRWAADDKQPQWWKDGRREDIMKKDLRRYGGSGTVLEFVATRDIEISQEIFLNYGMGWEEAWSEFVAAWSPPHGQSNYIDASSFNDGSNEVIRTAKEQQENPYPANVQTACFFEYYREYTDLEDVIDAEAKVLDIEIEWEETDYIYTGHHYLRPCIVMEREEFDATDNAQGNFIYAAQILNLPNQDDSEKVRDFERVIVTGIPRKAIIFVNKLYTTDQHLDFAFRHSIGMPDSVFPPEWKDLKQ